MNIAQILDCPAALSAFARAKRNLDADDRETAEDAIRTALEALGLEPRSTSREKWPVIQCRRLVGTNGKRFEVEIGEPFTGEPKHIIWEGETYVPLSAKEAKDA